MWKSRLTMLTIFVLLSGIVIMINPSAQETELAQKVFHSNRDGNNEIYVMDADGNNLRRLTDHAMSDEHPTWSAGGQKIASVSKRDGNKEIYVMNADGNNLRRLTNNGASDANPAWSPDSRKIAFYSRRDGNNEIYVMDADGNNLRRLTTNRKCLVASD